MHSGLSSGCWRAAHALFIHHLAPHLTNPQLPTVSLSHTHPLYAPTPLPTRPTPTPNRSHVSANTPNQHTKPTHTHTTHCRKRDGSKAELLDFGMPSKRKGGGAGGSVLDLDTAGLYRPRTKVWVCVCGVGGRVGGVGGGCVSGDACCTLRQGCTAVGCVCGGWGGGSRRGVLSTGPCS